MKINVEFLAFYIYNNDWMMLKSDRTPWIWCIKPSPWQACSSRHQSSHSWWCCWSPEKHHQTQQVWVAPALPWRSAGRCWILVWQSPQPLQVTSIVSEALNWNLQMGRGITNICWKDLNLIILVKPNIIS